MVEGPFRVHYKLIVRCELYITLWTRFRTGQHFSTGIRWFFCQCLALGSGWETPVSRRSGGWNPVCSPLEETWVDNSGRLADFTLNSPAGKELALSAGVATIFFRRLNDQSKRVLWFSFGSVDRGQKESATPRIVNQFKRAHPPIVGRFVRSSVHLFSLS